MTELSVVIPCLNEADTLAHCIRRALTAIGEAGLAAEVLVADNGSTDDSVAIAEREGARVVPVLERGYGRALMGGIAAARGTFVIMGDADGSYDFGEIPQLVARLREGSDLVLGCRLPGGGGRIESGAMPWLHRRIGNPLLTGLARWWFRVPAHDVYCGLRGFRREHVTGLDLRCTGMEYAVEMVVQSALHGASIAEIPITLHPSGRKSHGPHLHTFRDGWRTLRYFLLFSPRALFLYPGLALVLLGFSGYALALPARQVFGATLGVHTLLCASLAILCGYQALLFALFARTFAETEGFVSRSRVLTRFYDVIELERVLVLSAAGLVVGALFIARAFTVWRAAGYGPLDYPTTLRLVIPGVTLFALAFQTVISGFLLSLLAMGRR